MTILDPKRLWPLQEVFTIPASWHILYFRKNPLKNTSSFIISIRKQHKGVKLFPSKHTLNREYLFWSRKMALSDLSSFYTCIYIFIHILQNPSNQRHRYVCCKTCLFYELFLLRITYEFVFSSKFQNILITCIQGQKRIGRSEIRT